jgi:hypothetical protein
MTYGVGADGDVVGARTHVEGQRGRDILAFELFEAEG